MNISTIKNLYHSPDLSGEALVKPLKNYNRVSTIMKIFTGIIAYPALGLLAVVGMVAKFAGVNELRESNDLIKNAITQCQQAVKHEPNYYFSAGNAGDDKRLRLVKRYTITGNNIDTVCKEICDKIDSCSNSFRKVYPQGNGSFKNGTGTINLKISVLRVK